MIYDCFPFFNELDLLEIRLHELSNVVDRFVLVESTRTFQNSPKPLHYNLNKERFKEFEHKISHVIVDKAPGFFYKFRKPRPWDFSNFQKNKVSEALGSCQPEDIILISDLDEIPSAKRIAEVKDKQGVFVFQQLFCNYYLNFAAVEAPEACHLAKQNNYVYWKGTVMVRYKNFENFKVTRLMRDKTDGSVQQVIDGGWHFSLLGGYEQIIQKLKAWEHSKEKSYSFDELIADPSKLDKIIDSGSDLFGGKYRFDKVSGLQYLPDYVNDNLSKFEEYIRK
jgi:beta-1,4-mannosyl-glycoprotein beta-1,4-N-acetylglucosaminyltransferase